MTYTIGDRKISITDGIDDEDKSLILAHLNLFKFCLNQTSFTFLINLKNIIHLYSDIITIYSTLLRKVPNYDDITLMTNRTKLNLLKLEDDLNKFFDFNTTNFINSSTSLNDEIIKNFNWQSKSYEFDVKKISLLILYGCNEIFEQIIKNLNCIEIFFNNFNNLKKLLIPFLLRQTKSIQKSLVKSIYLVKLTTITDEISSINELSPPIIKQLRKIEKITSGIERESMLLYTAYMTFDPSLQQYTSILLGKAILKHDIEDSECQIIRRRDVCFRAAEHVVSIPLTEDQLSSGIREPWIPVLNFGAVVAFIFFAIILYRMCKLLFIF